MIKGFGFMYTEWKELSEKELKKKLINSGKSKNKYWESLDGEWVFIDIGIDDKENGIQE